MSFKVTRLGPPRVARDTITVGGVVFEATDLTPVTVEDEGTPLATAATTLDFVGAGVTASGAGATKTITIPGGSGLTVEDEGTPLATDATTLDFVGSGVTASGVGATKTITIPGGSGITIEDEGTPLSTAADTLDFVGAGVTASGSGTTKTITISGGGSSAPAFPFDDIALDGTYGDHYLTGPLDAKWTRRLLPDPSETFETPSWMRIAQFNSTNFGHLQPYTPSNEVEIRMAASYFAAGADDGFGPIIVDSAGTGVWLAFRNATRMGLFAVTTYTTATEPISGQNISPAGDGGVAILGEGRKVWYSLIKKGAFYYWRFSMDGATWTHELTAAVPSAFTPDRIGWYQGVQNGATTKRVISLDWFNVIDDNGIGNNLMITPSSGTVTPTANNAPSIGAVGNVIDGNTAGTGWGDNTSNATIWWMATFSVAQSMNRLRIWGYNNAWGMGYVEFSSGTKIPFFCAASQVMHLDFPTESTTIVKVWCQKQGQGTFPGFFEIEAYLAS